MCNLFEDSLIKVNLKHEFILIPGQIFSKTVIKKVPIGLWGGG